MYTEIEQPKPVEARINSGTGSSHTEKLQAASAGSLERTLGFENIVSMGFPQVDVGSVERCQPTQAQRSEAQRSEAPDGYQFVALKKELPKLTEKEEKAVLDDLNNGKWSEAGKAALQRILKEYIETEKDPNKVFKFMNDIGAALNRNSPKSEVMRGSTPTGKGNDFWFAMIDRKGNRVAQGLQILTDMDAGKEGPNLFKAGSVEKEKK